MRTVEEILDSLGSDHPVLIETGCANTRDIARWVSEHPDAQFTNVDLNFPVQMNTHEKLEADHTARYCTFLTKDHCLYLSSRTWADAVFLYPTDLQTGLVEFLLAVSTGAKVIAMTDYQTRSAVAIKRAKEIGWEFTSAGDLNILRRP